MARPKKPAHEKRTKMVGVFLTEAEAELLNATRGEKSRAAAIRDGWKLSTTLLTEGSELPPLTQERQEGETDDAFRERIKASLAVKITATSKRFSVDLIRDVEGNPFDTDEEPERCGQCGSENISNIGDGYQRCDDCHISWRMC